MEIWGIQPTARPLRRNCRSASSTLAMWNQGTVRLLVATLFGIHVLLGILTALITPFPTLIDERQHFSYARHIAETRQFWPDFRQMRVVDAVEPTQWGEETNYLTHPSVYYIAMVPFAGDAARFPITSVTRMRLAGAAISALAVMAALAFAMRAFDGPYERVVFAALVTLCPIANVMAGMINNDNLAFLSGSITFAGLIDAAKRGIGLRAAAAIGLGLALAGLTKLTVLLGLGLAVATFHLVPSAAARPWRGGGAAYLAVIALGASVGTLPYLINMARYGSLLYVHPDFRVPDPSATPLSPLAFLVVSMDRLAISWPGFPPVDIIERWTLPLLIVFFLVGALVAVRRLRSSREPLPIAAVCIAAVVAALILFTINFAYLYRARSGVGGPVGVYFRYYLPLWPGLAAAVVLALREFGGAWRTVVGAALLALLIYGSIGQLALAALS